MIIEIDGYFNQAMLFGKKCSKTDLRKMYLKCLSLVVDIEELPKVFCRRYNFEEISYDIDIKVDFVIDTDTDYIYTPY